MSKENNKDSTAHPYHSQSGLTKREFAAIEIAARLFCLHGIAAVDVSSNPPPNVTISPLIKQISKIAVVCADSLFNELEANNS